MEQPPHSRRRAIIVVGIILLAALGFCMKPLVAYLRSSELTGRLQENRAYQLAGLKPANHPYGKYHFVTDDGRWLAVSDHSLSEIFDSAGTNLFRRGAGYSLRFGKKLHARGVIHGIGVLRLCLAAKGRKDQLSYPNDADGLFDIQRIEWIK